MTTSQVICGLLRRDITTEALIVKNWMETTIRELTDEEHSDSCLICVEQFHGIYPNAELTGDGRLHRPASSDQGERR